MTTQLLASGKNRVEFLSAGSKMVGNLFCPEDLDSASQYPAIIVAGPLGTVKEQAPGVFAKHLAQSGFIALAFDFRTQGESEGEPKNYDSPFQKGDDIQNALSFLGTLEQVDQEKVGALGICAGASYTTHGIISDRRVKAFATVVAHFSLREFVGYNPMITDELRTMLLKQSNAARQKYYETGISENMAIIYPDATSKEDLPFSGGDAADIFDYYYERVEGCWPNFNTHMAPFSYEAHIKSHALDLAKDLAVPYLGLVGSEAFSKPYTDRFVAEIPHDQKEIAVIEGARHIQCYDKDEYIGQAIVALDHFFKTHLG